MPVRHEPHAQLAFPFAARDQQAGYQEASMDRIVTGHTPLSLDGRVSGPGGAHDMGWTVRHALTGAARAQLLEVTGAATTVLLDGPTYQGFGGFWPAVAGDEDADPRDRLFAQWLNGAEKLVLSRTPAEPGWRNTRVADDDPAEVVRRLRKEEGGDIVVLASHDIIRRLLEAGELDRLSIILCPELIGAGAGLFRDGPAGSSWAPAAAAPASSGALCLRYDLIRPAAGR
jgi:dihydrofolate reductase